jgi:hypothetical protein
MAVREAPCAAGDEVARHVMAWLRQPSSLCQPMTSAGTELGYELRLSRYAKTLC